MLGLKIFRKIKVLNRFNHILFAFLSLGLAHLVYSGGLARHLPWFSRIQYAGRKESDPKELSIRLRKTLEHLGPVFVKFGQILSTRSDLLPKEYIRELEHLQSHVPPFSYQQAERIIQSNFDKPVNEIFKKFAKKPFASASLGQVYEATLKSGERVAVKVQRPGAKNQIKTDIQVLYLAAYLIEKYIPSAKKYKLKSLIDEFSRWTLNELDYRKEAANCEIFSNFFKDDPHVYGPKVFWDYSAESVLTLEYIQGDSLNVVVAGKVKVKRSEIAHLIADSFIKQCFDYGFFHADPHPGNIFVINKNQLMFLDFGMVGFLDNRLTSLATSMFLSVLQKDIDNLIVLLLNVAQNYNSELKGKDAREIVDVNALRKELNELIIQWPVTTSRSGGFTKLFYEMMNVATRNGISIPTDLVMLSKAIVTLDRVVLDLDPKFDLAKWEKPLLEKIIQRRLAPKTLQTKAQGAALVFEDLVQKLPESSSSILSNLEHARTDMTLSRDELMDYERLLSANSKLSTYGTVLAGIIVAAALMYNTATEPIFLGLTLPQLALFTAGGLIVILFLSNLSKGK